ncbi:MAG: hypothetical protein ACREPR_27325 [Brasilonema sp.]
MLSQQKTVAVTTVTNYQMKSALEGLSGKESAHYLNQKIDKVTPNYLKRYG